MFDAGLPEAGFFHPRTTVRAGVIGAGFSFDQHVEAHQQTKRVLAAVIIELFCRCAVEE